MRPIWIATTAIACCLTAACAGRAGPKTEPAPLLESGLSVEETERRLGAKTQPQLAIRNQGELLELRVGPAPAGLPLALLYRQGRLAAVRGDDDLAQISACRVAAEEYLEHWSEIPPDDYADWLQARNLLQRPRALQASLGAGPADDGRSWRDWTRMAAGGARDVLPYMSYFIAMPVALPMEQAGRWVAGLARPRSTAEASARQRVVTSMEEVDFSTNLLEAQRILGPAATERAIGPGRMSLAVEGHCREFGYQGMTLQWIDYAAPSCLSPDARQIVAGAARLAQCPGGERLVSSLRKRQAEPQANPAPEPAVEDHLESAPEEPEDEPEPS